MSHIVHSSYCPHKHSDHRRISIDTQILRQLVIATLDKSTVNPVHRTSATGSDTRCQCHGMFLGNTYIHKLTPCLFPAFRSKTYHSRSTRADGNNRVVLLHLLQQKLPGQAMVILHTAAIHLRLTRFQIERHLPMKFLPVGFCRSVSLSFLCVNMNTVGRDVSFTLQKPQSKTEYHSPLPHKDNPTPENGRNYRTTVPPYRAVPSGSDRAHRGFRQWTFHYH